MQDGAVPQSVTKSLLNRKHSHCMSVQTMMQSSKILITICRLDEFLERLVSGRAEYGALWDLMKCLMDKQQ